MIKNLIQGALFCLFIFVVQQSIYGQDTIKTELKPFLLSDISTAIEETEKSLNGAQRKLETAGKPDDLLAEFRAYLSTNESFRNDTSSSSFEQMSMNGLRDLEIAWIAYQKGIKDFDDRAHDITDALEYFRSQLDEYNQRWQLTADSAEKTQYIEAIRERITGVMEKMRGMEKIYELGMSRSFVLIDTIAEENLRVTKVMRTIRDAERELQSTMFNEDSPKFFDMLSQSADSAVARTGLRTSVSESNRKNFDFVTDHIDRLVMHVLWFFIMFFLFYTIRNNLDKHDKVLLEPLQTFIHFIRWPGFTAITLFLFMAFWIYPSRPSFFTEQMVFLVMIPSTIMMYSLLKKGFRLALLALFILFIIDQAVNISTGDMYNRRVFMMWESVVGAVFCLYFSMPRSILYSKEIPKNWRFVARLFPIVPLLFIVAIYANLEGLVQLSRLINGALVKSAGVAIILLFVVWFSEGFLKYMVISKLGDYVKLLRAQEKAYLSWTRLIIRIWAIYVWVKATLGLMQLRDSFNEWWDGLMELGWEFGEASLTIGLLVEFVIILLVFSVIANLSRVVLEVEILPRFNLKKGVPMAIAVMTRYTLLVLGFFMAVAAAGISLDKLGFLAGALGVGIGFGLQNVVGNFVSGLILIFERPIHIDDVIVAGNIEGVVKEVGIRSSRIRTWDGAEVIVPNNDLISRQVTNWTLSDTKRRREHLVKVELGTDPNKVIEIISDVLTKDEDVLDDPTFMVLFQGFKEYSLDFRVLFWLNANLLTGDSAVALSIHNELKNAGINMAYPRQKMIVEEQGKVLKTTATSKRTTPRKPKSGGDAPKPS